MSSRAAVRERPGGRAAGRERERTHLMAEVSWLSDYMGSGERSADRFGLGSDHGVAGPLGGPGIAGLLGIGLEADAQSWQERALCAETDPEAFFPEKGGSTREAKKICTGCEVKA